MRRHGEKWFLIAVITFSNWPLETVLRGPLRRFLWMAGSIFCWLETHFDRHQPRKRTKIMKNNDRIHNHLKVGNNNCYQYKAGHIGSGKRSVLPTKIIIKCKLLQLETWQNGIEGWREREKNCTLSHCECWHFLSVVFSFLKEALDCYLNDEVV